MKPLPALLTAICLVLGAATPLQAQSYELPFGLSNFHLSMGIGEATPLIAALGTEIQPLTNLQNGGAMFKHQYRWQTCTFNVSFFFSATALDQIDLSEQGSLPACPAAMKKQLIDLYGDGEISSSASSEHIEWYKTGGSTFYNPISRQAEYRPPGVRLFYNRNSDYAEVSLTRIVGAPPVGAGVINVDREAIGEAIGVRLPPPLPQDLALEAAQAALDACRKRDKYSNVVVAVYVQPDLKVFLSAGTYSTDTHISQHAVMKAVTVMNTGRPSGEYTKNVLRSGGEPNKMAGAISYVGAEPVSGTDLYGGAGALPIRNADNKMLGVISVDGMWGKFRLAEDWAADEACAQAGIDKIKARLPR